MLIYAPLMNILPAVPSPTAAVDSAVKAGLKLSEMGFFGGFLAAVILLTYIGVRVFERYRGRSEKPLPCPALGEIEKVMREGAPPEAFAKLLQDCPAKNEIDQLRTQFPPHLFESHRAVVESIKIGMGKLEKVMANVDEVVRRTDEDGVPKVYAGSRVVSEMVETTKDIRDAILAGNKEHSLVLNQMILTLKQMSANSQIEHRAIAETLNRIELKKA